MPHSFSHAVSMNLEHSIKEGSHEGYPVYLQCFRNIKKIKYPDFQAMTDPSKLLHAFERYFKPEQMFSSLGMLLDLYTVVHSQLSQNSIINSTVWPMIAISLIKMK